MPTSDHIESSLIVGVCPHDVPQLSHGQVFRTVLNQRTHYCCFAPGRYPTDEQAPELSQGGRCALDSLLLLPTFKPGTRLVLAGVHSALVSLRQQLIQTFKAYPEAVICFVGDLPAVLEGKKLHAALNVTRLIAVSELLPVAPKAV